MKKHLSNHFLLYFGLFCIGSSTILDSCTDNQMARNYGGEKTIELPSHNIFINATWKESELWYITKDTTDGKYYLREKSNYGIWEGKIIFQNPKP